MKKQFVVIAFAIIAMVGTISSCKKTESDGITEPITISNPDSTSIFLLPGKEQPIEIKFTTDRPIQYVKGMYEVDSSLMAGHVYTYPDTLFYTKLDSADNTNRVNKYTYTGKYTVADTLLGGEIIRFRISMQAKNPDVATSVLNYQKEFKITVK